MRWMTSWNTFWRCMGMTKGTSHQVNQSALRKAAGAIYCPFCGMTSARISTVYRKRQAFYRVDCINCGAHGPQGPTTRAAILAWNNRPEEINVKSNPHRTRTDGRIPEEVQRAALHGNKTWRPDVSCLAANGRSATASTRLVLS